MDRYSMYKQRRKTLQFNYVTPRKLHSDFRDLNTVEEE